MASSAMGAKSAVSKELERVIVAGVPVDRISFADTVKELCDRIEQRKKTHVLFINAAKVVKYRHDEALAAVIRRADLLLADGVPIVWASKLRKPLPGRVNGTDLMEGMVAAAAERGYRVYFLGATSEVIEGTVQAFRRRHPRLIVAGYRNGYFKPEDEPAIIDEINATRPDLLFLGISTPQKEFWADRNLPKLNVAVCEGVGGSFDVIAGLTARAPRWMQRSGLEWFYRFLQEPRRMWKRYLMTNSEFVWLVLRDVLRGAKG